MVVEIMQEKKQKKLTTKRLENIALYYLSRYDASVTKLTNFLNKRTETEARKGTEIPENVQDMIQGTVQKMQNLGYIDDERYAENLVRRMSSKGRSKLQIAIKAKEAGVNVDLTEYDEEEAAMTFARKKHLGINPEYNRKDIAKMVRMGFSYQISSKILKEIAATGEETEK